MYPAIAGAMAHQRGLVTRAQAIEAGMSGREIDLLVRAGAWVAVRRGVYAEAETIRTTTTRRDRQRIRDDAACLRIGRPHVRSHDSAALVLDMPILLPRHPMTHVTRPRVTGSRHEFGVKHHLAPFQPGDVVTVGGVACLDPARTAVDIAREHGHPYGVVAYDSALRTGASRERIAQVLAGMKCWPHVTRARSEFGLADPNTDSIGETLGRDLVERLGYGRPQTQFGLTDGHIRAWADMRLGRHLIEFDGRLKYRPIEDGGVADGDPARVLLDEKDRQDFLTGFKLGMSRLTWDDVYGPGTGPALRRLDREYLDTCERFGTAIDDLAPYILPGRLRPRMRHQR